MNSIENAAQMRDIASRNGIRNDITDRITDRLSLGATSVLMTP